MTDEDTIAAVSTGSGQGGIGIVRISGPFAVEAADRFFRAADGKPLTEAESHTVHYGSVFRPGTDDKIDEALVTVMRAPRSYTREDVVEIGCHGGAFVEKEVLEAALRAGARLAQPGEFTKRAFLNGRIDLTQAEAVMDLIESRNSSARKNALAQLGGLMRRRITEIRTMILDECALIEAAMDDPEHFDLAEHREALLANITAAAGKVRKLIDSADDGAVIREGIKTVILGRPNVGKSTFLNALAGSERAIVTEIAGTTRDILEETVTLGGIMLRLMDTAGLRESGDRIERIGISRAKEAAENADLILYLIDGSEPPSEEDRRNLAALPPSRVMILLGKGDLARQITAEEASSFLPGAPVLWISALYGSGIGTLAEMIREKYLRGGLSAGEEVYITNTRQKEALERTQGSLDRVLCGIRDGVPEDLLTVDLMDAYTELSFILGEEAGEDLIDGIFSRFCLGK